MNPRVRSYRRESGTFYVFDCLTGKRENLKTTNPRVAERLIQANKNVSHERPAFNLLTATQ
ncbi:MAG: hypothetical protein AB7J34_21010 [Limisphaerales bacterium]